MYPCQRKKSWNTNTKPSILIWLNVGKQVVNCIQGGKVGKDADAEMKSFANII